MYSFNYIMYYISYLFYNAWYQYQDQDQHWVSLLLIPDIPCLSIYNMYKCLLTMKLNNVYIPVIEMSVSDFEVLGISEN